MNRPVNLIGLDFGLPMVGLGSLAVQRSIVLSPPRFFINATNENLFPRWRWCFLVHGEQSSFSNPEDFSVISLIESRQGDQRRSAICSTAANHENHRKQFHEKSPPGVPWNLVVLHWMDIFNCRARNWPRQPSSAGCFDNLWNDPWSHDRGHQQGLPKLLLEVLAKPATLLCGVPSFWDDSVVSEIAVPMWRGGVTDDNVDHWPLGVVFRRNRIVRSCPWLMREPHCGGKAVSFVGIVMIIGLIILPSVLLAVSFFSAFWPVYRSRSPTRPLFLYSLIGSLIVTSGFTIWGYHAICTSKSSTAAIGFFILPLYSIAVAFAGLLISWSFLYVGRFAAERLGIIPERLTRLVPLLLAIALLTLTGYVVQNKIVRYRLLNDAASGTNADSLATILADGIASRDLDVLSKLAKNPNTPISDLVRLYDFCKPNITKSHPSEYPVLFSLAQNSQTPSDILAVLAGCRPSSIRYAVAINPSTPTKTLRLLAEDSDDLVKKYAKPKLNSRERDGR